jgi:hypothetical protein
MFCRALAAVFLLVALAAPSFADVAGAVSIIDGNTIARRRERAGETPPELRLEKVSIGCVNRITNEKSIVRKNRIRCCG